MIKVKILCLLFLTFFFSLQGSSQILESQYQFQETIDLIEFVETAAAYFSQKGAGAFIDFGDKDSKWIKGKRYLFLYDLKGNCIFHPYEKEFVGTNILDLQDMNGKPVIRNIIDVASNPSKPYGWIHYLWAERGEIFPYWKSAYVMKVNDQEGNSFIIGSGTYQIHLEKKFMLDTIDAAANLIKKEGEAAYSKLVDKSTMFYFSDVYIFVISMEGKAIVDPVFPGIKGRDLIDFKDGVGKYVVREMIDKLQIEDKAFIVYLWPQPGQSTLSKKMLYVRKVKVGNDHVIVGSGLFIVEPIWK
ncbi:MAG: cache domain-containing protein [Armatimonadetes bacterium]|nr:cache domain-containing protein [Armatimonadota bacterium]